jgi:hypothetical protein
MILKALIIEQLALDGTMKTLRLNAAAHGIEDLVVAFADAYAEPREGPLHFLDEHQERLFSEEWGQCRSRRLSDKDFSKNDDVYHFHVSWRGIPTRQSELSLYALSLPEFANLTSVHVTSPHTTDPELEFERTTLKDIQKNRYVIYVACRSRNGMFDFDLNCTFEVNPQSFSNATYHDVHREAIPDFDQYGDLVNRVIPNALPEVRDFFAAQSGKTVSVVSGGVNANAEQINVGADMVGRDKIVNIVNVFLEQNPKLATKVGFSRLQVGTLLAIFVNGKGNTATGAVDIEKLAQEFECPITDMRQSCRYLEGEGLIKHFEDTGRLYVITHAGVKIAQSLHAPGLPETAA